jgi:hypothetical protein
LLIGETTVVHIGNNAQIQVQKYLKERGENEDIELSLKVGDVKALIGSTPNREKNFRVRSRSHIMGVRGTEIFISAPPSLDTPVTFLTLEGRAEISSIPVAESGAGSSGTTPPTSDAGAPSGGSEGQSSNAKGNQGAAGGASPRAPQGQAAPNGPAAGGGQAPVVLTANQSFRPGETIQILTPERAADISRSAGPAPGPDRPGQPPMGGPRGPVGPAEPPRLDIPFRPGQGFGGPGQVPFDPTLDRVQPHVPVEIQFDPD